MKSENVKKAIEILTNLSTVSSGTYLNLYYIDGFVVKKIMCMGVTSFFNHHRIQYVDFIEDFVVFVNFDDITKKVNLQDLFFNSDDAIRIAKHRVGDLNKKLLSGIESELV